jgi:hypothetical protein
LLIQVTAYRECLVTRARVKAGLPVVFGLNGQLRECLATRSTSMKCGHAVERSLRVLGYSLHPGQSVPPVYASSASDWLRELAPLGTLRRCGRAAFALLIELLLAGRTA